MREYILPIILTLVTGLVSCDRPADSKARNKTIGKDDSVTYYTQNQIDSFLNDIMNRRGSPTVDYRSLGASEEDAPYLVLVRTQQGRVQVHEQWDDVVIIRSGHGILKTGNQVTGEIRVEDEEPWRDWLGGVIQDAREIRLSPGDFIVIPAMTAHQYIPNPGDTLSYWTMKVKRTRNQIQQLSGGKTQSSSKP